MSANGADQMGQGTPDASIAGVQKNTRLTSSLRKRKQQRPLSTPPSSKQTRHGKMVSPTDFRHGKGRQQSNTSEEPVKKGSSPKVASKSTQVDGGHSIYGVGLDNHEKKDKKLDLGSNYDTDSSDGGDLPVAPYNSSFVSEEGFSWIVEENGKQYWSRDPDHVLPNNPRYEVNQHENGLAPDGGPLAAYPGMGFPGADLGTSTLLPLPQNAPVPSQSHINNILAEFAVGQTSFHDDDYMDYDEEPEVEIVEIDCQQSIPFISVVSTHLNEEEYNYQFALAYIEISAGLDNSVNDPNAEYYKLLQNNMVILGSFNSDPSPIYSRSWMFREIDCPQVPRRIREDPRLGFAEDWVKWTYDMYTQPHVEDDEGEDENEDYFYEGEYLDPYDFS